MVLSSKEPALRYSTEEPPNYVFFFLSRLNSALVRSLNSVSAIGGVYLLQVFYSVKRVSSFL
jgi:hypothetical protein